MIVYTDGSVRRAGNNLGPAGAGVFIEGKESFSIPLGIASPMTAEASAMLIGISMALDMPRKKGILVRTDCKALVDQLHNPSWGHKNKDVAYKDLRNRLRELITSDTTVEWIPRESNKEADKLAREASSQP